ncbi:pantoate--beta-alanine ligase [Serpentinicella sp. ANB-PHB4]|uniref:pantoate--beta-alanine ligase n=1 Tax=Serpentinicella sp. ANB-PHB4 TaxID=3074076 RepID=UPI00286540B1|nr:pantoate--beta-alanine ligase [Serpentinicella sp. ANB-PHB4]MDR5658710.1 pantoate--beta-alanine ligase [Serpentinicella sp. ANB-PHB4]
MQIVSTVEALRKIIKSKKSEGKSIGFVPTMGFLHEGHLSLIKRAKAENDFVVVSVFVNPTQFGPNEDLSVYPRDLERDTELSEKSGADLIFHPTVEVMYPEGSKTTVNVTDITEKLCGASRPGHFQGVTTVVTKLFNIVSPHRAYFGEKDAQQLAVIQKMVEDLNMDIEVVPCPIVREKDGLAMSSRNVNLTEEDRKAALVLSKSLMAAKEMIEQGEKKVDVIYETVKSVIESENKVEIDYIEIVDGVTLEAIDEIEGKVLIALAAKVGKVRLIDNIIIGGQKCC